MPVFELGSVPDHINEYKCAGAHRSSFDRTARDSLPAWTQTVEQASTGGSYSTHDATRIVSDTFAYPFSLELTYNQTGSFYDYSVALDHAYDRALTTPGAVPRTVHTRQHCDGSQVRRPQPPARSHPLTMFVVGSTRTRRRCASAPGRRRRRSRMRMRAGIRSSRTLVCRHSRTLR